MAVAVRSVSTNTANATSVIVTKPSGTTDGDYLLACGVAKGGTPTPPAGWTQVDSRVSDSIDRSIIWYRIASSEGASYTFTCDNTNIAVGMFAITGAATGTAPTANGQANASSSTCTAPTITPAANSLILLFGAGPITGTTFSSPAIATSDPGLTEQYEINSSQYKTVCATGVRAQATATGNGTMTMSGAQINIGQLVSIAPPLAYTMTAAVGSFTLTGVAAALSRIYKIVCGTGAFTLTGVAATLKWFSWIARTRPTSTWTDVNRSDQV